MHSLGFKVFADFNTASRGISVNGFAAAEAVRVSPGCRDIGRLSRSCRIVACASERNGGETRSSGSGPGPTSGSLLSRSQTYAFLKQQMEVAAKSEDYEEAARIRDSVKSFESEELILRLGRSIKEVVADEKLVVTARFRDEHKMTKLPSLLKCSSDATTLGIRVQVKSVYIEGRSQPSKGEYYFAYRIRITNNSDRPVQLLRRQWIISDANGKTENFWGVGVIGEQPVVLPHTGFEYSSACPVCTPSGRMEGNFEMKHIHRVGAQNFNAAIAPFSLAIMKDDANTFET